MKTSWKKVKELMIRMREAMGRFWAGLKRRVVESPIGTAIAAVKFTWQEPRMALSAALSAVRSALLWVAAAVVDVAMLVLMMVALSYIVNAVTSVLSPTVAVALLLSLMLLVSTPPMYPQVVEVAPKQPKGKK